MGRSWRDHTIRARMSRASHREHAASSMLPRGSCGSTLPSPPEMQAGGRPGRPWPPRSMHDCWFLSGPTATGKTALALAPRPAARCGDRERRFDGRLPGPRHRHRGSHLPSSRRGGWPHHLIDVVSPAGDAFSVAHWLAAAAAAVDGIRPRGRRILFVGGTPLYLRPARDGLGPACRAADLDAPGSQAEARRPPAPAPSTRGLPRLDPAAAAPDPSARRASGSVRALEVA